MSTAHIPSDSSKKKFSEGLKAVKKNQLLDAETLFAEAISEDENHQKAWFQLGMVWTKMGRIEEAQQAFQMAATLDETDIDSLYNLGLSLVKLGQDELGITFLSKAADLSPSAEIATAVGDAFYQSGKHKQSSYFLMKAHQKNPADPTIKHKLAISLYWEGDTSGSIILFRELLLKFPNTDKYQQTFAEAMNKCTQATFDPLTKKALEICLNNDDLRHKSLAPSWCTSFAIDPEYEPIRNFCAKKKVNKEDEAAFFNALQTPFLCLGLRRLTTSIENDMMPVRQYFLMNWEDHQKWPSGILSFLSSLAIQCWYNDFVFFESKDEKEKLKSLLGALKDQLSVKGKISGDTAKLLALASCYVPLYEIDGFNDQSAFAPSCKAAISHLYKIQFKNPRYEHSLIPKIKSFTEIEDTTSKAVQKMYESRPYPRWTSVSSTSTSAAHVEMSRGIEILVAGCGTGQEPCSYASLLPLAKITAIDLSRSSIAYATRMAEELGYIDRITFLHGDLMKVKELNKKFDYVASSGVLHHLKEPEKGLAAILETLKPNGRLSISLYSKYARDLLLNPGMDYIKEKGYTSSLDDIRQFRMDILSLPKDDPRRFCSFTGDFYSLSECNDLLFHIQEHRYTLPLIQDMANRYNLVPQHVRIPREIKMEFLDMFPNAELSDLATIDLFEQKRPRSFVEMYHVHFRRVGENAPHPLDNFIETDIL